MNADSCDAGAHPRMTKDDQQAKHIGTVFLLQLAAGFNKRFWLHQVVATVVVLIVGALASAAQPAEIASGVDPSGACQSTFVSTDPFNRPAVDAASEFAQSGLIQAMMDTIHEQNARSDSADTIDSVIVIRSGRVVLEEYPNPAYGPDRPHPLFSVTKSVTSLLIGMAIDRGWIDSVNDPVLQYLPDAIPPDEVQSKSTIAIQHLLTMSAGLEWDEDTLPTSDPRNDFTRLEMSFDPIGFVLGKPLIEQPGSLFWYNTGLSHVLSALITEVSGQTALEFARAALFDPLGIVGVSWNRDRQGIYFGGTQLYLTPRDLARIGVLCLSGGIWNGQQIVSSQWLSLSTRTHILGRANYFEGRGYGYQWWTLDDYGVYYASGSQGQALYIFPELDLVIAFTATLLEGAISPEILVRDYILPAIVGAGG